MSLVICGPAATEEPSKPGSCPPPEVALWPVAGGLTRIVIESPCRQGQLVTLTYSLATFLRQIGPDGRLETIIDCFAGGAPIAIAFEDRSSIVRNPVTQDLATLSKVAVLWSSSVNVDLHAFEYAANEGEDGHVWQGNPRSLEDASQRTGQNRRASGFLSSISEGREIGMNAEVYTVVHPPGTLPGGIKIAVDYESRGDLPSGDFCGEERFAALNFKAVVLSRGVVTRQLDLAFAGIPCGTRLPRATRLNARLIPEFRVTE